MCSYDANGNITTKTDATGTTLYQYDYENRLIKATEGKKKVKRGQAALNVKKWT